MKKNYLVRYKLVGEQLVWVQASSQKEAKEKIMGNSADVDPVSFNVTKVLVSTAEIMTISLQP